VSGTLDDLRSAVALRLEAERANILAEYENALAEHASPLIRDAIARQQVIANADGILSDLVQSLRTAQPPGRSSYSSLSADIGAARAAAYIHPRESLRAAMIIFDLILTVASAEVAPDDVGQLLNRISLTLNESISMRVREGAISYSSFLLNRIHEAHIIERRRIARELHDRIGHALSTAHRHLELSEVFLARDAVKAAGAVESAYRAVQEAMESVRSITAELRLQEPLRSLEKALAHLLDSLQAEDVSLRLQVSGEEGWATPVVLDESFLIIREAIRNSLSHGNPSVVIVSVDIAPHELRAWVEDDGSGFDWASRSTAGVGLSSMQERAALIGGRVTVNTTPGQGTHIELIVSLPGSGDEPDR
jgi:signal transduction histidine kinase